ncbi:MAG TPA: CHASE domain-containing protein, partial [Gallionella sp.]|nr:CHASE domain-containing protein [Gallionella sp.]
MPISWNIPLVFLSVLIAIVGSAAALDHGWRMRAASGLVAKLWMVAGSVILGMSIWGVHSFGILAFNLPVPVAYDLTLTLLSILPAVAAALLGFWTLRCIPQINTRRILAVGLLMGLGISMTHYTGMAALRMSPPPSHDLQFSILSVAIAIIASWSILLMVYQGERIKLSPLLRLILGAAIMGVAIFGAHHTAMLGIHFQSGSMRLTDTLHIDRDALAVLVFLGLLFSFCSSFFMALFSRRAAKQDGLILAGLVLTISLMVTYQLWNNAQQYAMQIQQLAFDAHVEGITGNINKRMKTYEEIMRGVDGLFAHADMVRRNEFRDYVDRLQLKEKYPGIQSIRFVQFVPEAAKDRHIAAVRKEGAIPAYNIWPEGRHGIYAPIVYAEPFDERNEVVFGYDMLSDSEHPLPGDAVGMRRAALEQARDSGSLTVSGRIRLLFEAGQDVQHGFTAFLPVYRHGPPHNTIAERRANIAGWVVSVFRMGDLMSGTLDKRDMDFDINIFDGEKISENMLMYASDRNGFVFDTGARFQRRKSIDVAGHKWTALVRSRRDFENQLNLGQPRIIASNGVALSILLTLITW